MVMTDIDFWFHAANPPHLHPTPMLVVHFHTRVLCPRGDKWCWHAVLWFFRASATRVKSWKVDLKQKHEPADCSGSQRLWGLIVMLLLSWSEQHLPADNKSWGGVSGERWEEGVSTMSPVLPRCGLHCTSELRGVSTSCPGLAASEKNHRLLSVWDKHSAPSKSCWFPHRPVAPVLS